MPNHYLFFVLPLIIFLPCIPEVVSSDNVSQSSTELSQEWDDTLLLLSTLDGSFIGVEQMTGFVRWKLKDEPVVKVPIDNSKTLEPIFLPDPKDGSLYMLGSSNNDALKKLPFTIPQLVASSPCRSSDGILYTGKKIDSWFSVDPKTGIKQQIVSFDKEEKTCPVSNTHGIFIGRTEYNIMMLDSKRKERKWNVTFFDYSSSAMDNEKFKDYDLIHFTASASGRTVSLNRRQGTLLWDHNYGSPVIAIYVLDNDSLVSVPFTSVAEETMNNLVAHFSSSPKPIIETDDMKLYPTLYVGEHHHGLYALPSLVDENTITIKSSQTGPLLLEGPPSSIQSSINNNGHTVTPQYGHIKWSANELDLSVAFRRHSKTNSQPIVILGHYKVPDYSKTVLQIGGKSSPLPPPSNSMTIIGDKDSDKLMPSGKLDSADQHSIGTQTDETETGFWNKVLKGNYTFILSTEFIALSFSSAKWWFHQQENKGLKVTFVVCMGCIFSFLYYLHTQVREFQQISQGSRGSSKSSSIGNKTITALPEDVGEGIIRVGKITFNTDEILGKGCEGTFVYKGSFDNRAVAVKRILPECFTFADREVDLLRESDEHPHVVRYFCTEQDKQFRYIALELCAATLYDLVEGHFPVNKSITVYDILYQSTLGLEHLHALDIVHRDIKPPNVLLSMPNAKGEVRVMISDFGLCKKLKVGRMSFSRRSGVTGTEGWIAPEMLSGETRTTCSVDIFSLGCVFYYVLSNGKHPFGDALRRQANILSGESKLSDLEGDNKLMQRTLVEAMINTEASLRPPASAIVKHPLFWKSSTVLTFFQDVSDRIEKEDQTSKVLQILEKGSNYVVRDDWRNHIDEEVAQDLRKYRNYSGRNIRDLLRALRNKKHHYRELSSEIQSRLGDIPNKFVEYWTCRFPLLLLHTWLAMQCVKHEAIFSSFYHKEYNFKNSIVNMETDNVGSISDMNSHEYVGIKKVDNLREKTFRNSPKKSKWSSNLVENNDEPAKRNIFEKLKKWNINDDEDIGKINRRVLADIGGRSMYERDWRSSDDPVRKYWSVLEHTEQKRNTVHQAQVDGLLDNEICETSMGYLESEGLDGVETQCSEVQMGVTTKRSEQTEERKSSFGATDSNTELCTKFPTHSTERKQVSEKKEVRIKKGKRSKQKANEIPLEWRLPEEESKPS